MYCLSLSTSEARICLFPSLLSGEAGTGLPQAELAFSKVFPRPQGVPARPISGRTGTRRVLAWAKPILCTALSAVMELADDYSRRTGLAVLPALAHEVELARTQLGPFLLK